MISEKLRWFGATLLLLIFLSAGFVIRHKSWSMSSRPGGILGGPGWTGGAAGELTKSNLAGALEDAGDFHRFPSDLEVTISGKPARVVVQYAFDPGLQDKMESLFKFYRPDYGAFVAIDPATGKVLSLVSYSDHKKQKDNLALRATFPAASIFKVVTAAAAIAERNFSSSTVIPFNGRNHTLYRAQILKTNFNRWTRHMTLKEAFARSVNTVFGRIGAYTVGAEGLKEYADRFAFNRKIISDIPVQEGRAFITDDPWSLAEIASGYTRESTMSPLQGALIAAAIANDGLMMEPYAVQSVHAQDGSLLYLAEPQSAIQSVDPATADEIRAMMRETIVRGTSRKTFRGFFRGELSEVDVGGKTGSLTGLDPEGKYDWFVGYADYKGQRIAIAALTIHQKLWRVKSSYIARQAIEKYYRESIRSKRVSL